MSCRRFELIGDRQLFGALAGSERFVAACRSVLASLQERGACATLESPA